MLRHVSTRFLAVNARRIKWGDPSQELKAFLATAPKEPAPRRRYTGVLLALAGGGVGIIIARQMGFLDGLTGIPSIGGKSDYGDVRKEISSILENEDYDDGSYGPILVRLAWHASGTYDQKTKTGGSNGATMRFPPEADHGANAGLDIARRLLDPVKAKFPWISYADLWTLAGVVAIEEMGGPSIPWRPGRQDAVNNDGAPPDGRLPDGAQGAAHVRQIFYRMGFDDREIVALTGAHTLGRCHRERSGWENPWTFAPTTFSNLFFKALVEIPWRKRPNSKPVQYEDPTHKLMMLPSDMALLWDSRFKKHVQMYAENEELFFKDFSQAFSKLLELGVPFPEQEPDLK